MLIENEIRAVKIPSFMNLYHRDTFGNSGFGNLVQCMFNGIIKQFKW